MKLAASCQFNIELATGKWQLAANFTHLIRLSYAKRKMKKKAISVCSFITKTYLYNFDPLKPHFYIVKLGFTGVYIIFLISAQKHRLWALMSTHNLYFEQKHEKYQNFLSENFHFLVVKLSVYLNRHVFVMVQGLEQARFAFQIFFKVFSNFPAGWN